MDNVQFNKIITPEQLTGLLLAVQKNGGTLPDGTPAYEFQQDENETIAMLWRNSLLEEPRHLATFHPTNDKHGYSSISISTDFYEGESRYSNHSLSKDIEAPYGFFTDQNLYRFQNEAGRSILHDSLSDSDALYKSGLSSGVKLGQYPDIKADNAIYVAQGMIAYTHPNANQEFLVSSGAAPCVIVAIRNNTTGVTSMAHFDSVTDIPSEINKMYQSVFSEGDTLDVHLAGSVAPAQREFSNISLLNDIKETIGHLKGTNIITDITGREVIRERLAINVRTGDIITEFPYRYPPDYGIEDSQEGHFIMDQRKFNLALGFSRSAEEGRSLPELTATEIRHSLMNTNTGITR